MLDRAQTLEKTASQAFETAHGIALALFGERGTGALPAKLAAPKYERPSVGASLEEVGNILSDLCRLLEGVENEIGKIERRK